MIDCEKIVVGYVRVSTSSQASDGESLETQKAQIREFCDFKKWKLIFIYEDAGISGSKADHRPAFMQMISDASECKFNIVIFTKLSRFARNARDYYNFQYKLKKYNVTLSSIKENIDPTSHNGRLMAGIFALLADWEREMIQEQMSENKMIKWREKRMFNGSAPYGYSWDKKECVFIENIEESSMLNLIFKWYVEHGISMRDITLKLCSEGFKSRRANWSNGTISDILRNGCYGECKLKTNTHIYVDGKRTNEFKDESEWIIYDLPPIVPRSLCDKVFDRREFNIKKQKRTTWQEEYWLRDSLTCLNCEGKLRAKKGSVRIDGTYPRYYICHWGTCSDKDLQIDNRDRCIKTHIYADDLELYVWDQLTFSLTGNPILVDDKAEEDIKKESEERFAKIFGGDLEVKIQDVQFRIVRLTSELESKTRAKRNMLKLLEKDDCVLETINTNMKANQKEIDFIQEKILLSRNEKLELEKLQNSKQVYLQNSDSLFDLWCDLQDFTPQDKKRLIESVVPGGVKVLPAKNMLGPNSVELVITWNDSIFELLQEEGKLPSLGTNGTNHLPRFNPGRGH